MNEMMEKVAKAIFAEMEFPDASEAEVYARAAVEAMREPTASMLGAAKKAEYARYASPGESMITTNAQMIKLHHEAMIDEALK